MDLLEQLVRRDSVAVDCLVQEGALPGRVSSSSSVSRADEPAVAAGSSVSPATDGGGQG
jgi:hypothetical protein